MYHFEKESFREALRGLSMAKFKDVFYELGARTLQVKIYYEMEEDDSAYSEDFESVDEE